MTIPFEFLALKKMLKVEVIGTRDVKVKIFGQVFQFLVYQVWFLTEPNTLGLSNFSLKKKIISINFGQKK